MGAPHSDTDTSPQPPTREHCECARHIVHLLQKYEAMIGTTQDHRLDALGTHRFDKRSHSTLVGARKTESISFAVDQQHGFCTKPGGGRSMLLKHRVRCRTYSA